MNNKINHLLMKHWCRASGELMSFVIHLIKTKSAVASWPLTENLRVNCVR